MAPTGLSRPTLNDISRVTESLEMLAPTWNVWVLMTLASQPLRYAEIKPRLPWLHDGQLHPKLGKLVDAGLVERTEHAPRHVTYGLTSRGTDLMPVLAVLATWGDTHLEKPLIRNEATGELEPKPLPPAQNIEDTLALITPRHTTALLWVLKSRGTAGAKSLAAEAMPETSPSNVYPPLRRLIDDDLIEVTKTGDFQLSASGQALAPAYQALSAWAAGRSLKGADAHPLWGQSPAPSQARSGAWLTTQSRRGVPSVASGAAGAPALSTRAPATPWRASDLFSHQMPARPSAPAGGPRR
ncbi:helix-turn-helix domain-containing protein [Streptomyces sp. NPDC003077]|uniref:winged helix-turn-helix transcriptional regulator n=1 Tax=Streptomyces sp. NPDC003077 TaxID=3154443 RepID=UPI0033A253C4